MGAIVSRQFVNRTLTIRANPLTKMQIATRGTAWLPLIKHALTVLKAAGGIAPAENTAKPVERLGKLASS
jgi:hypothetical protein